MYIPYHCKYCKHANPKVTHTFIAILAVAVHSAITKVTTRKVIKALLTFSL